MFDFPKAIPYRLKPGEVPALVATNDKKDSKPVLAKDAHAKVFDLQDPKQLQEYESILTRQGKQEVYIAGHNLNCHEGKYRCFVVWYELFIENPDSKDRKVIYR